MISRNLWGATVVLSVTTARGTDAMSRRTDS
jgi:hypothetical protein